MKKQQGFIIPLLVIIVILIIGAYLYIYTNDNNNQETKITKNTEEEKPDKKDISTYTDSKYGFEFQYPSDLILKEDGDDANFKMNLVDNTGKIRMEIYDGNLLLDHPTQSSNLKTLGEIQNYITSLGNNKNIIVERHSDRIISVKGYYRSDPNNLSILIEPQKDRVIQFESYDSGLYEQVLGSIKFK
jgi:uncharacterized protein YxeA